MSSDLQSLVNQCMVSEEGGNPLCLEIAIALTETKKFTFLQFIQYLGKYLTEDSENIRSKAIVLICDVLEQLPKNSLSLKDCYFMVQFLINRLDDDFKGSIQGIESLITMNNFKSTELIDQLLTKLQLDYEPRQLLAKNRYTTFKILSELLDRFATHLSSVNDLFIKTFIKVSTGEKDPRNLMISFDLNYKISTQFDISSHAEDLFDNSFCYFPISFKPPPNDPYKITTESLKTALRKVLGCNSLFAKDCIPNLIDKLSSTSSMVKLDSLYTLIECIEHYSSSTIKEYSMSIWNSLKYEILHNELANVQSHDDIITKYANSNIEEDHVVPVTLSLFQKLFIKLTEENHGEANEVHMTTEIIVDESLKNIESLDDKFAKQSIIILSSLAATSAKNYNMLISKVFPVLFQNPELSIPSQRLLVSYLSFFFDAYKTLGELGTNVTALELSVYKDDIMNQLSKSLMSSSKAEVSLRCLAIKNLTKIANLPEFLDQQESSLVVQYFTEVLLSDDNPTTFQEVLSGLIEISLKFPNLILELTIPRLLILLPDSDTVEQISEIKTVSSKEKVLEILSKIVENKQILDVMVIRLLNKIQALISSGSSLQYIKLILNTMTSMIEKTKSKLSSGFTLDDYLDKFFPQFLFIVVSNDRIADNDVLLEVSSKLLKMVIANSDSSNHMRVVESLFNIFIKGSQEDQMLSKPLTRSIKLLESPNKLIVLFTKVLLAVERTSTHLPVDLVSFVTQLIEICKLDSLVKSPFVRLGYLQALSLVVNKYMKSTEFLDQKYESFIGTVPDKYDLAFYKELEVLTWVTKALILKDDPSAQKYEDFIVDLLMSENPVSLALASKSIEVLIAPCDVFHGYTKSVTVFGKEKQVVSNIDMRLLYKQKFYNYIIPKLSDCFKNTDSTSLQKNYLINLALVLKYVDDSILTSHLEEVVPLIAKLLFFDVDTNTAVIKSSLKIVLMSLPNNSKLILNSLSSIIPRLLELIQTSSDDDIKTFSLQCLISMCISIDVSVLLDYKEGIIRNLIPCLDDRRRSIRKLAADCRQAYFDLGLGKE